METTEMVKYASAYRGYLLTHNVIRDEWYITRDGFLIGTLATEDAARAAVDGILD